MDSFITVKVGKLPGTIAEIALNGDRTVNAALTAAGLSASGFEIRVNSGTAEGTSTLRNGDTVLLVKKIKGNLDHITVKVGKLPGTIAEIALNGDRTVAAALGAAGLSASGFEIRVNSGTASETSTLRNGDTVLLVKKIKGN